jgi:hypothetical protein
MKRVYFAGKVKKNGWRDRLFGGGSMSRGEFNHNSALIYVGPFAIGCDHGCFHDAGYHGLLGSGCCGFIGDSAIEARAMQPSEAVERCLNQVSRADSVVAYLDRDDCPGTMVEVGYALALRKPVLIFDENPIALAELTYPAPRLKDELWFVKSAPGVVCLRGPVDMEEILRFLRSTD